MLRTTRRLHLDSIILESETTGSDPLPDHLGNQVFTLKTHLETVKGPYEPVVMREGGESSDGREGEAQKRAPFQSQSEVVR